MSSSVVDLEQIVISWAWQIFKATKEKSMKNVKFEDLGFEINWDTLRLLSETPFYSEKKLQENSQKNIVFESVFENRTSTTQDNRFSTLRKTVCKCVTSVKEGFKKGFSLGVRLGVPYDVMRATATYGREVAIENTEQSAVEKEITWSVDTNIKVKPNTRATARLEVEEQQFTATYQMQVIMSGHIVVSIYNKAENNSLIQNVDGDIGHIVKGRLPDMHSVTISPDGKTILWRVVGTCDFVYGVRQNVVIEEESLRDELDHVTRD